MIVLSILYSYDTFYHGSDNTVWPLVSFHRQCLCSEFDTSVIPSVSVNECAQFYTAMTHCIMFQAIRLWPLVSFHRQYLCSGFDTAVILPVSVNDCAQCFIQL